MSNRFTLPRLLLLASGAWLLILLLQPTLHGRREAFYGTVGILSANALLSLWTITKKRKILIPLNAVQIVLFGVLSYQLSCSWGEDHYRYDREPRFYDWIEFTIAHIFRAADVIDALDEYGIDLQNIKHNSTPAAIILIVMHVSVDVFLVGMLYRWFARVWKRLPETELATERRGCALLLLSLALFLGFAIGGNWRWPDWFLWPLDNTLRLLDIGDMFELFHWRLHDVGMEFWTRSYAIFFRLAVGVWLAKLVLSVRLFGFRGWGISFEELIEQLAEGDANHRQGAARALGAMGAEARQAVPSLLGALKDGDLYVRQQAAKALGRIGLGSGEVVAALTSAMWRRDARLRLEAVTALGNLSLEPYGPEARESKLHLCTLLKVSEGRDEAAILKALRKIAPETAESRPLEARDAGEAQTELLVPDASAAFLPVAERDPVEKPVATEEAAALGELSAERRRSRLRKGEAASLILVLREEHFFDEERTIGDIQAELAGRGSYLRTRQLASPLHTLCKQGGLSRRKNDKGWWLYKLWQESTLSQVEIAKS